MKLDIIAQLVQILRDAPDVGAIEIRRGPFGVWSTVRVSRAGHGVNTGAAHVVVAHPAAGPGGPGGGGAALAAAAPAGGPVASGPSLLEIKSPMVGTYYRSPEPGAEPYVKPGSRVAPGQVVCIIEAMKIMNEIESDVAGVIRESLVENGQPVEFGQVLYRVDPHA
ncbi:MAG: acetyl-CoA carboxylase, biotin carboxyl carrier protein [Gemmatimonadetes bacterium 13_1_40CM_4_69_5]|nr:MAG: acetyl-CoA carboxylase, biotin carboxyl carrier protein [Gemmatimonadetes bacterium 13_1_40CM_4_69_5]